LLNIQAAKVCVNTLAKEEYAQYQQLEHRAKKIHYLLDSPEVYIETFSQTKLFRIYSNLKAIVYYSIWNTL